MRNWPAIILLAAVVVGYGALQGNNMPPVVQDVLDKLAIGWWLLALYLVATAAVAVWKTIRDEKAKGVWIENQYLYNTHRRALTTVWRPEMNGSEIEFKFGDAPPRSLVHYRLEFDPGGRIWGVLKGVWRSQNTTSILALAPVKPHGKVIIGNDHKMALQCHALENTVPSIVAIYILGWEVFPNELLEYETLGTRIVVEINGSADVAREIPFT